MSVFYYISDLLISAEMTVGFLKSIHARCKMVLLHTHSKHSKSKVPVFPSVWLFLHLVHLHFFFFFFCQSICLHRLLIDCITCKSHSILPLRHCEKLQKVCWKNHLTFIQLNRTSLPLALIFLAGEE